MNSLEGRWDKTNDQRDEERRRWARTGSAWYDKGGSQPVREEQRDGTGSECQPGGDLTSRKLGECAECEGESGRLLDNGSRKPATEQWSVATSPVYCRPQQPDSSETTK